MALLQALFSFISRSAGKVLNAIFGWAVVALFGRTSPKQQLMLTGLVAAAALWPVLLLGIAFPRVITVLVSAVPLTREVPAGAVRVVWLVLAVVVPFVVGGVVAAKTPLDAPKESAVKKVLRGFPITLGLSSAFLLMFVTVPVLRLLSAARRRRDEHVPCVLQGRGYDAVAAQIDRVLKAARLDVTRTEPSWWLAAPSKVLRKLGGAALRGFMPDQLAYWKGPTLELAFYPSDVLIRGERGRTALVHGLLAEQLVHSEGLQTFTPTAQALEREIRNVWRAYDRAPLQHRNAPALRRRLAEMTAELSTLEVEYSDWQVLYRQLGQLDRALDGEPQLIESLNTKKEQQIMNVQPDRPLSEVSTQELVSRLVRESKMLVRAEVALAKSELTQDLRREIHMVEGIGIAAVCGLITVNLLLVALVLGLSLDTFVMPGWAAALAVSAVVLVIGTVAGLVGWAMRVKQPLSLTRKTLKEDVQWAKERMA